jgi:hypothetical protein
MSEKAKKIIEFGQPQISPQKPSECCEKVGPLYVKNTLVGEKWYEPAFPQFSGALREESIPDVKSIYCNGFTDLRGDQRIGYEYSGFCEILGRWIASPYDGLETSQSAY